MVFVGGSLFRCGDSRGQYTLEVRQGCALFVPLQVRVSLEVVDRLRIENGDSVVAFGCLCIVESRSPLTGLQRCFRGPYLRLDDTAELPTA
jgi:hypothetical protein